MDLLVLLCGGCLGRPQTAIIAGGSVPAPLLLNTSAFAGQGLPERPLPHWVPAGPNQTSGTAASDPSTRTAASKESSDPGGPGLGWPAMDNHHAVPSVPIYDLRQLNELTDSQLFEIFTQGTAEIPSALATERGKAQNP